MSYNNDQERAQFARGLATFLTRLVEAGFTREEAMQIVVAFVRGKAAS